VAPAGRISRMLPASELRNLEALTVAYNEPRAIKGSGTSSHKTVDRQHRTTSVAAVSIVPAQKSSPARPAARSAGQLSLTEGSQ
jgi:hypothetical protein